ncbi:MAG: hypothetical protein M3198_04045 [Actinomycetota bacterium]|nr:hypothetical protein [Actinomycetota bacterium]
MSPRGGMGFFMLGAGVASVVAWREGGVLRARMEAAKSRLMDEQRRQKQALEINDDVVQGLAVTMYALEAGDHTHAKEALRGTLDSARQIIAKLLGDREAREVSLAPGDLIRLEPAAVVSPSD